MLALHELTDLMMIPHALRLLKILGTTDKLWKLKEHSLHSAFDRHDPVLDCIHLASLSVGAAKVHQLGSEILYAVQWYPSDAEFGVKFAFYHWISSGVSELMQHILCVPDLAILICD